MAFQAQGACMALLSVRVFFKKCPPLVSALSSFPETIPRTLVQEAQGVCVEHAAQQGPRPRPPKLFCGEDGQWVGQPTTSCACVPGFEPAEGYTRCTGNEGGKVKPNKTDMRACMHIDYTHIGNRAGRLNKNTIVRRGWRGVHWGLKCLRGNERPRKLMRQGNGCDTEGTEREVRWSSTYLWKEEQGQRLTAATTPGSAEIEGAQEDCRGEGREGGEVVLGVKIITLWEHQSKADKKRRKKQDDSLRSRAAALPNESN